MNKHLGLALLIAVLASLLTPRPTFASDLPDWALKKPKEDSSYRYYVGRAIDLPNDAQAIEAATKAAITDAIRDNFGTTAQIQNQTFETSTTSSVVSRSTEQSKAVRLNDFNLMDSFIQKRGGGYSAWVLYRYSMAAIAVERKRLAATTDNSTIDFTEVGNASLSKGQLEIVSDPVGASIFVDGEKVLGKTPLRLSGQLDFRSHIVQLEHPEYVTVEREVIISPNKKTIVTETLVPATGHLTIQTEPEGASVLVDGQFVGASPVSEIKVSAGKPVKIDFIHIDTEKSSEEIRVAKNESKVVTKQLPLKPAMLQVVTNPTGADVLIDGKAAPTGWTTIDPGRHIIAASKGGYESGATAVDLRGGERKTVKLGLTPWSEIKHRVESSPWIVGVGFGFYGATYSSYKVLSSVGLDITVEKKVFGLLGLRLSAAFISADETVGTAMALTSS